MTLGIKGTQRGKSWSPPRSERRALRIEGKGERARTSVREGAGDCCREQPAAAEKLKTGQAGVGVCGALDWCRGFVGLEVGYSFDVN